ncbi:unnamed protein product [Arabis nemorensis]|uniref:Peptidase C1A papain C-terminal domain-containing protein n=1 Tax=Arabis nemorensis TaxID=586526 RepID=A0A565AX13_9BRAS|nr:unnamed protein product [Arabis nemorensis]
MEEEDDEDKIEFSFGGGGRRTGLDLPPGTKKPDFEWTVQGGVMREVMDQGNRRVCWTVAASRELSGRLIVAERFDPPLRLSALHLLVGLIEEVDSEGGLKRLGHLRAFMIEHGTILEDDCKCPQLALQLKEDRSKPNPIMCTEKKSAKRVGRFKVHDLTIKKVVDETEIMHLLKTGPVAVGINVYEEFSDFEGDGIYPGPNKGSLKIDDHLFIVYGYGTTPEGIHYWKVQNSAGRKWGKDGFGKIIRQISRPKGQPSLFTRVVYPTLLVNYEGQKVQRGVQRGRHFIFGKTLSV